MKRVVIAVSLVATAAALVACNAILGLQEPVLDDTIGGDAQKSDVVAGDTGGDGGAQQLVSARTNYIALDNDYVYYTAALDFSVGRVGKDGTNKLVLANGMTATGFGPSDVAIDATDVFWTDGTSILQCKKTGCNNSPTYVLDENAVDAASYNVVAYAVDDAQTIYFADYDIDLGQTTIYSMPKGVADAPVAVFIDPASLAFCPTLGELLYDSGKLYYLCQEGPIGRIDTSTKAIEQDTTASAPANADSMVLGGSSIYYTQFTATGSVFSLAIAPSSTSMPLVLDQLNPDRIDIDQQYLYWTIFGTGNSDGAVMRCKLGTCSTTVTPLVSGLVGVIDVKTDGVAAYYSVPGANASPSDGIYKVVLP